MVLNMTGKRKGQWCPWGASQTVHVEDDKGLLWMCSRGDMIGFTQETGIHFEPIGGKGKGYRCPNCGNQTLQPAKDTTGDSHIFVCSSCKFVAIKLPEWQV